jgi:hypothetical protein
MGKSPGLARQPLALNRRRRCSRPERRPGQVGRHRPVRSCCLAALRPKRHSRLQQLRRVQSGWRPSRWAAQHRSSQRKRPSCRRDRREIRIPSAPKRTMRHKTNVFRGMHERGNVGLMCHGQPGLAVRSKYKIAGGAHRTTYTAGGDQGHARLSFPWQIWPPTPIGSSSLDLEHDSSRRARGRGECADASSRT